MDSLEVRMNGSGQGPSEYKLANCIGRTQEGLYVGKKVIRVAVVQGCLSPSNANYPEGNPINRAKHVSNLSEHNQQVIKRYTFSLRPLIVMKLPVKPFKPQIIGVNRLIKSDFIQKRVFSGRFLERACVNFRQWIPVLKQWLMDTDSILKEIGTEPHIRKDEIIGALNINKNNIDRLFTDFGTIIKDKKPLPGRSAFFVTSYYDEITKPYCLRELAFIKSSFSNLNCELLLTSEAFDPSNYMNLLTSHKEGVCNSLLSNIYSVIQNYVQKNGCYGVKSIKIIAPNSVYEEVFKRLGFVETF